MPSQSKIESLPLFLSELHEQVGNPDVERRISHRFEYVSAVPSLWIHRDGQPAGDDDELILITKDIGNGGIGFFHTSPIMVGDLLRMTLERPDAAKHEIVVEVRHCRRIGPHTFLIGARFAEA